MSGDLIDEYLAGLRASLRTPPERTAQILAEAEDHLRESAASGEALGLTPRDAQEAAIAAFGPVAAVVKAHRRPAAAILAEAGMAAWRIAAIYLLVVACTGVVLITVQYALSTAKPAIPGISPPGYVVRVAGPHNVPAAAVVLAGVGIAGLILLIGQRRARRSRLRQGRAPKALLGGYFPLVAAVSLMLIGPVATVIITSLGYLPDGLGIIAAAAAFGSLAAAVGYTIQMARLIVRQGRDTGTTGRDGHYAG